MTRDLHLPAIQQHLSPKRGRLWSLDVLRGAVIVLMALDHVRLFWANTPFAPTDLSLTTPGWFFARWITHFCAPVFIFLAGTSAYLYARKAGPEALRRFLFSRGLWLLFVELAVISPSLVFGWPPAAGFFVLQVIWAIGWGMVVLGLLSYLPKRLILAFGVVLVAGHNLLDGVGPEAWGRLGWLWKILHMGESWIAITDNVGLLVVYPLVPWVGVMALGYCLGEVMSWERARRRQFLGIAGLGLIEAFFLLRFINFYGDPSPWDFQSRGLAYTALSFLNTTKYPPSLLYFCMTMGPALLLLYALDGVQNKAAAFLRTFGRVPFFFYVVHFAVINFFAHLWHYFRYGRWFSFLTTPKESWPADYVPSLLLMYGVWAVVVIGFYCLCRWYGEVKFSRKEWWWKYL
ncbi:MAG: DUF1624 domain-containing protein [Phaeodactylibacter sp.]|nr:DUF1624 domain-containing protein [Phaeodactylibacter sp.]